MAAFSDSALPPGTIARAQSGSHADREAIVRAFDVPVRTLARRLVSRRAAADDIAQDVFCDVLARLGQFDGRGSFAGWVRAITVNCCLMHLRSPWHRGVSWVEATAEALDHATASDTAGVGGQQLDLERALARLGDTARVVVWLHDVEGYTHAEIGTLLGGTSSFSKSQLARAHERLRGLLEPGGVEESCMPAQTSF